MIRRPPDSIKEIPKISKCLWTVFNKVAKYRLTFILFCLYFYFSVIFLHLLLEQKQSRKFAFGALLAKKMALNFFIWDQKFLSILYLTLILATQHIRAQVKYFFLSDDLFSWCNGIHGKELTISQVKKFTFKWNDILHKNSHQIVCIWFELVLDFSCNIQLNSH